MFITHDIFPFVNVFVVTNILTRNYHEFYFILKFVAFYYTIYHSLQLLNFFIPLTSFRGIALAITVNSKNKTTKLNLILPTSILFTEFGLCLTTNSNSPSDNSLNISFSLEHSKVLQSLYISGHLT